MRLISLFLLVGSLAFADTPPPNSVKAKMYSGDGSQAIGNVSDALKMNVTNSSIPVTGTFWQATQPVSISGSVPISAASLPLPLGASTSAAQASLLSALGSPFQAGGSIGNSSFGISGTLPAFASTPTFNLGTLNGAATAANQASIITALGSPFQVGGSIGNTSFGISGTLPAFASTPTFNLGTLNGASTAANQATEIASLASIDSKITAVNTGAVVVSSSALPSGAASAANQTTANASLSSIDSKLSSPITVTQTAVPSATGRSSVTLARNAYASVNVTTSAYVQLVASTSAIVNEIEIFDSSGQTLVLAVGGSGSEVDKIYITPGGNGRVPLLIPSGSRVSIKAVSASATSGEIDVNFYQ